EHGLVIVTKDFDFLHPNVLLGGPKVIWIRLGNCSTGDIIRLLTERQSDIEAFIADGEASFLDLA
ncbi:MAG: DUF5615 family PIN-like protein, partial [Stellaceae bacterium]